MRLRIHLLGMAIALSTLSMFAARPAYADYTGTCANISTWNGQGKVAINQSGACTLSQAVSSTSSISITASGAINTQALTASGGALAVTSTSGGVISTGAYQSNNDLNVTATAAIQTVALTAGGALNVTTTGGPITSTGTLTSQVNDIKLSATGNINTQAISAAANFGATTTGGTIKTTTIDTNMGGITGNVLVMGSGDVGLGVINTHGGASSGFVEIDAHVGDATSTPFTIGTAGATNGVTSVNTSNTTAGTTGGLTIGDGLFVVNGSTTATGGITITNAAAIDVSATGSRAGGIYLYGQMGTITLPGGRLNADAKNTGQGAGDIELYANKISTVAGTIISAKQDPTAYATDHPVALMTTTLDVGGATQLIADGNGYDSTDPAWVIISPPGGCVRSSNQQLDSLLWGNNNCNNIFTTNKPVTVSGAGSLLASANGNTTAIYVGGYPLKITNTGGITLQAKGAVNHNIQVGYSGSYTGISGLEITGGAAIIDASGMTASSNDAGGQIHVYTDQATISASSFTMHADGLGTGAGGFLVFQPTKLTSLSSATALITANGVAGTVEFQPNGGGGAASITSPSFIINANAPASNPGNAGSIYFYEGSLTLGASTKAVLTANGPTSGAGNGGTINVSPGTITNLKLGTNGGDLQVIANGGSTTGNGGTIFMNPNGSITIDTANAVSATLPASSTQGIGGSVSLYGNPNFAVTSGLTGAAINVDGKGTGTGGTINIQGNGTLALGTAAGGLSLSAQNNGGTGSGGTINVGYATTVTVGSPLLVSAGMKSGSDGSGGTVNLHDANNITVTSTIDASGDGSGSGGTITISGNGTLDLSTATVSANGGCNGGNGGTISETANALTANETDADSAETCSFVARSNALSPRVSGAGNGGTYNVTTTAQFNTVQSAGRNQNGSGMGKGGTINFNTGSTLDMSLFGTGSVTAQGGNNQGLGGTVTVVNLGIYPTNSLIDDIILVNSQDLTLSESSNDGQTKINGVTCQQRNLPSFGNSKNVTYRYCDGTTQLGTTLTGLSSATRNAYQAAGVRLYIFANQTAASSYLGSAQIASDPSAQGFSLYSPSNYSVIYDTGNNYFAGTVRHEIGHQIDQNASTAILSESAYMNDLMNEDWTYFNTISRCTLFPTICNTPPYNTESNKMILQSQAATASYFNPTAANPVGTQWREIFAEEFSIGSGVTGNTTGAIGPSVDNFLAYFYCTQTYVTSVYKNGHTTKPNYSAHSQCSVPADPLP